MKLNKLLELIEKHNIPKDVTLMSNSGWECGATDMDGIYYNEHENIIVFTQYIDSDDNYHTRDGWVVIGEDD